MADKFTPERRAGIVDSFAGGCSLADAASANDISTQSLKAWLAKGRKESEGEHAKFALEVDRAKEFAKRLAADKPMDERELIRVVSLSARVGNTQAMKLRWEMIQAAKREAGAEGDAKPKDPIEELDELAARRTN